MCLELTFTIGVACEIWSRNQFAYVMTVMTCFDVSLTGETYD